MSYVMAFDVSMGKSTVVIYDDNQQCHYEGEVEHTTVGFRSLKEQINLVRKLDGQLPEIVFEATGFIRRA